MELRDFEKNAQQVLQWMTTYLRTIEEKPVKSQVKPGSIRDQLPQTPPESPESFDSVMRDLDQVVVPGVTHWQHPMFYAYFPAQASPPSILAEMITATMGLQCMLWETSPAATELEQRMMEWLRSALGLPKDFTGVIQDSASMSTLCALLAAREQASEFTTNQSGLNGAPRLAVYCSTETHSSIEKAVRIIGIGNENLRKIEVDDTFAMRSDLLEAAIVADLARGIKPVAVVATIGTTGCAAVDSIVELGPIARKYGLWLHVDAAYAGAALVLPETRWAIEGLELADSFVMNCHKWLMVNFDCSCLFVKDPKTLKKTFEIYPEYLLTAREGEVDDFRNFGVQLGRRFRALKLWMVFRSYGLEGMRRMIREHINLAREVHQTIQKLPDFEVLAPCNFGLVSFRYKPANLSSEAEVDRLNRSLVEQLNSSGEIYLTHTKLRGRYTLRLSIGQLSSTRAHVMKALEIVVEGARAQFSAPS
jgi:aromatic-L-amino-acid decarboxylase